MDPLRQSESHGNVECAEVEAQSTYDKDHIELARTGKKQVFKRNFSFWSMLGFNCTLMATWEAVLVVFLVAFNNGGPAGLVYGFLITWIGNLSVFVCMGELVSIAPTAGGQYHWVAMLAPPSSKKFLCYITGWITCAGWQAALTTTAFFVGTLIQGMVVETHPEYDFQRWHGTLLAWAVSLLAVVFNTVLIGALPKLEGVLLVLNVVGFVAILVPLVHLAPHGTASEVFTVFLNGGHWKSQGLSFFVGLVGNSLAFVGKSPSSLRNGHLQANREQGTDGAVHMCEEIKNASTVVPWTMIGSLAINGLLAFAMLIAVLFCMGDLKAALATPTGYPFIAIFTQTTGSKAGATVMSSVIAVLVFSAIIAALASSSRMIWSFSRDRGLPGWRYLSKIDTRTSTPLLSIALTTLTSCLLTLINIGSRTAFDDVLSLSVACFYSSYLIVCGLLLYRRLTASIKPPRIDGPTQIPADEDAEVTWGPWHVPGVLGISNNLFACAYLVIVIFFSFWPAATPTTAATMNYSVLVTGFVLGFSILYYVFWARRFFSGPIVEIGVSK